MCKVSGADITTGRFVGDVLAETYLDVSSLLYTSIQRDYRFNDNSDLSEAGVIPTPFFNCCEVNYDYLH